MNQHGAERFVVAIAILLSTICFRVTSDDTDSADTTAVLNVKDFSAIGDGKTDDSLAFTTALNSLGERGGTLLVPSSKYLVGGLKIGSNTTLKGTGVPRPNPDQDSACEKYSGSYGRGNRGPAARRSQCHH